MAKNDNKNAQGNAADSRLAAVAANLDKLDALVQGLRDGMTQLEERELFGLLFQCFPAPVKERKFVALASEPQSAPEPALPALPPASAEPA